MQTGVLQGGGSPACDLVLRALERFDAFLPAPRHDVVQALVSCILSQRVAFAASEATRQALISRLGLTWSAEALLGLSDADWCALGVADEARRDAVRSIAQRVAQHPHNDTERSVPWWGLEPAASPKGIHKGAVRPLGAAGETAEQQLATLTADVRGVGPWTRKAVLVLCDLAPDVFLSEDAWVRKRLGQLYFAGRVPSAREAQTFALAHRPWDGVRTRVSHLRWRLTAHGAARIAAGHLDQCAPVDILLPTRAGRHAMGRGAA